MCQQTSGIKQVIHIKSWKNVEECIVEIDS